MTGLLHIASFNPVYVLSEAVVAVNGNDPNDAIFI